MATLVQAPGADGVLDFGTTPWGRRSIVGRLLSLSAILWALALSGCASHSVQRDLKAYPTHADAPPHRHPEPRARQAERVLLAPQPAPNCEYRGSDLDTVDPDLWARLKLDFERRCYQHAEMIARNRLRLLQTSARGGVEPVPHRRRMAR